MNITTIAGNIGKDAELRRLQDGTPVAQFSVAVDNGKDKSGNRRESTWFDCSIWGKRGEALEPYIKKGGKVTVSGRVSARAHEGKAYLQINAQEITLQGSGGRGDQGGGYDSGNHEPQGGGMDDEIPF